MVWKLFIIKTIFRSLSIKKSICSKIARNLSVKICRFYRPEAVSFKHVWSIVTLKRLLSSGWARMLREQLISCIKGIKIYWLREQRGSWGNRANSIPLCTWKLEIMMSSYKLIWMLKCLVSSQVLNGRRWFLVFMMKVYAVSKQKWLSKSVINLSLLSIMDRDSLSHQGT